MKLKVLVASRNKIKKLAVEDAFRQFTKEEFEVFLSDTEIDSGVSKQPLTQKETAEGALNRLKAIDDDGGYDYYVAIEGGVFVLDMSSGPKWFECACAAVSSKTSKQPSIAFAPAYPIPKEFVKHLKAGKDLTEAMEIVTGIPNTGAAKGFNGWLTGDKLDRRAGSALAVLLALYGLSCR